MTYNNPIQGTNVSPYYDDFDDAKGFLRMLFRPGRAVQGRELTQMQTLLQDQIGKHADHIFKDRTVITGGGIGVASQNYLRAEARNDVEGFNPTDFIGSVIYGVTGTELITDGASDGYKKAKVVHAVAATSDDPYDVYFIQPLSGNEFNAGDTFRALGATAALANTTDISIPSGLTGSYAGITGYGLTGSSKVVTVDEGIFYVDKFFVKTEKQSYAPHGGHTASINGNDTSLRLYSDTNVSKSVGFAIGHEVVEYTSDPSLLDPSSGTSNFTAPGADRYKMNLTLEQRDYNLPDADDSEIDNNLVSQIDYFEMCRLYNGIVLNLMNTTQYSGLDSYFAERTFDESGNYTVNGFNIEIREHLRDTDNEKFKDGVFSASQGGKTGNYAIKIGAGKAYVEGYPYTVHEDTTVSATKPRTSEVKSNETIVPNLGLHVKVNNSAHGITLSQNTFTDFDNMHEVYFVGPNNSAMDGSTAGAASNVGAVIGKGRLRHLINSTTDYADVFLADIEMGITNGLRYPFYLIDTIHGVATSGTQTDGRVHAFGANLDGVGPRLMKIHDHHGKELGLGLTAGMTGTKGFESRRTGNVFRTEISTVSAINSLVYTGRVTVNTNSHSSGGTTTINTSDFNPRWSNGSANSPDSTIVKFPSTATNATPVADSIAIYDCTNNEFLTPVSGSPSSGQVQFITNTDERTKLNFKVSTNNTPLKVFVSVIVADPDETGTVREIRKKVRATGVTAGITFAALDVLGNVQATIPYSDIYRINSVYKSVAGATTGNDIKDQFLADLGQKSTHYDHAKLTATNSSGLTGNDHIVVDFDYYKHDDNDENSFGPFTRESYPDYEEIPSILLSSEGSGRELVSLRDCVDYRPARVNTAGSTAFNTVFVPKHSASEDSGIVTDYGYYMGRIDQLYLRNDRTIVLKEGDPGRYRPAPDAIDDGMLLATITLPPYVYNLNDVPVRIEDNRRYTMRDIGRIKDKVDRLEYYTALSLIEQETENQLIVDADGLPRFKNGIFVDPMQSHFLGDMEHPDYNIFIDDEMNEATCPQANSNIDLEQMSIQGLVKTGDGVYVLEHKRQTLINQTVRSNKISVNPYNVVNFVGDATLHPESDTWTDTERLPVRNISQTIDATLDGADVIASRMGTVLAGTNQTLDGLIAGAGEADRNARAAVMNQGGWWWNRAGRAAWMGQLANNAFLANNAGEGNFRVSGWRNGGGRRRDRWNQVRVQRFQASTVTTTSEADLGDRVVSTRAIPFMRAKNIRITITGLKPNTVMYPYFDGNDVGARCTPANYPTASEFAAEDITVTTGASGGELKTDANGKLALHFDLPAGQFRTGQRMFRITDDPNNSMQLATCSAEANYVATGLLRSMQRTNMTTSVRRTRFIRGAAEWQDVSLNRSIWVDPVAQTIMISADEYPNGVFVRDVDLFFANKDESLPVSVEIRPSVNGYPSSGEHIPMAKVVKDPDDVIVATNWSGNKATRFKFKTPIYLTPGEYAIVVISNSDLYEVWHSTMGEYKLNTDGTVGTTKVTEQPYMGSFFKSQNASTWTADQNSDLCFRMGICNFKTDTNPDMTGQLDLKPVLSSVADAAAQHLHSYGLTANGGDYRINRFHKLWPHFTDQKPGETSLRHETLVRTEGQILTDAENTYETVATQNESEVILNKRKAVVVANDAGLMSTDERQSLIHKIHFAGSEFLTPVIDGQRMSISVTEHLINNNKNLDVVYEQVVVNGVTGNGSVNADLSGNYNGEFEPNSFGNNSPIARYISRPVPLDEDLEALGLSVFLSQEVPLGTDIHVFARFLNRDSEENIRRQKFVRLLPTKEYPKEYGVREIEYKLNAEEAFGTFQVKFVLYADPENSVIPLVTDLRAIAVT